MELFDLNVEWLNHACFKIKGSQLVYFDPYRIKPQEPADLILITHEHFDHCSRPDVKKILQPTTTIVASNLCRSKLNESWRAYYFYPDQSITISGVRIETLPAYNLNKFRLPGVPFHPKDAKGLGYVITMDGVRIYHAGDTDFIPEMKSLRDIDIALVPVSGTYVMTPEEAAEAVKTFKPKVAIPMHIGTIVGGKEEARKFKELASNATKVVIPE